MLLPRALEAPAAFVNIAYTALELRAGEKTRSGISFGQASGAKQNFAFTILYLSPDPYLVHGQDFPADRSSKSLKLSNQNREIPMIRNGFNFFPLRPPSCAVIHNGVSTS